MTPVALPDFDIAMFCVPTPFDENTNYRSNAGTDGKPDMSSIKSAIINHGKWLRDRRNKRTENDFAGSPRIHQVVVIRITVQPGATRNVLLPLLELHSKMKVGVDLGLCVQPEFLRRASSEKDSLNPRATEAAGLT